jgi:uncharacterized protein (TIGR03089 family)
VFGIWWIGAEVATGGALSESPGADIAFCTADRRDEAGAAVGMGEIAALSLDPFGKPVPDLPVGITDYATAVRVHGDQIVAEQRPGPALAGRLPAEVLAAAQSAAAARGLQSSDRVLSTAGWDSDRELVDNLLAVFAVGASLVQCVNLDPAQLQRRRVTEKVSRLLDGP